MHSLLILLCWIIGYFIITSLFAYFLIKYYISKYKTILNNQSLERYLDNNSFEIGMLSFFWPISIVPILCSLAYERIIKFTLNNSESNHLFPDKEI